MPLPSVKRLCQIGGSLCRAPLAGTACTPPPTMPYSQPHLQGGRPLARKPREPMKRAYAPPNVCSGISQQGATTSSCRAQGALGRIGAAAQPHVWSGMPQMQQKWWELGFPQRPIAVTASSRVPHRNAAGSCSLTVMSGRSARICRPTSDRRMRSRIAMMAGRPAGRSVGRAWVRQELRGRLACYSLGMTGAMTSMLTCVNFVIWQRSSDPPRLAVYPPLPCFTHLWSPRLTPPGRRARGCGMRPTGSAVPPRPSPARSVAHGWGRLAPQAWGAELARRWGMVVQAAAGAAAGGGDRAQAGAPLPVVSRSQRHLNAPPCGLAWSPGRSLPPAAPRAGRPRPTAGAGHLHSGADIVMQRSGREMPWRRQATRAGLRLTQQRAAGALAAQERTSSHAGGLVRSYTFRGSLHSRGLDRRPPHLLRC